MSKLSVESFNPAKPKTFSNPGTEQSNGVDIDHAQLAGGSIVSIGTLANSGQTQIGNTFLAGPTNVTISHVQSFGTMLLLEGGVTTPYQTTLNVTGDSAPSTLTEATWIQGDAVLAFASGGITTIDAQLVLEGAGARIAVASDTSRNSAFDDLASNKSPYFILEDGASIATVAGTNFINSNQITIDDDGVGGSSLSIGGALTNADVIKLGTGPSTDLSVVLRTSDAIHAASLANSGTIDLSGSITSAVTASLQLQGNANNSGTINLLGFTQIVSGGAFTNSGSFVELYDAHPVGCSLHADSIVNSGTLDLTGDSNTVIADRSLTVSAGGMMNVFNATITAPKINVRGYLHATGTIIGNITVQDGSFGESFLHPPAALSVDGGLKLGAAGSLEVALDGSAASGGPAEIEVSGKAQLGDSTLRLNITNPQDLAYGDVFAVLSAGSFKGTFGSIQDGNLLASGSTLDLGNGQSLQIQYSAGAVDVAVIHTADAAHAPLAEAASHQAEPIVHVAADGSLVHHDGASLALAAPAHAGDWL